MENSNSSIKAVFCTALIMLTTGCASFFDEIKPPAPFVWNGIKYAHPALAVGNWRYYQRSAAFRHMTPMQQLAVRHYGETWSSCNNGVFDPSDIVKSLSEASNRGQRRPYCTDIMRIYVDLYQKGFRWTYNLKHFVDRPLLALTKTYQQCASLKQGIGYHLNPKGRAVFYCT